MSGAQGAIDPDEWANQIRDVGEQTPGANPFQVLPGTAASPGFGVAPAKDSSPEELQRVGRDYAKAMLVHYQSPVLAAAAYNAGPGQVDAWLRQHGDPREAGGPTPQAWTDAIGLPVTQNYVSRMMGYGKVYAGPGDKMAPGGVSAGGVSASPASTPMRPGNPLLQFASGAQAPRSWVPPAPANAISGTSLNRNALLSAAIGQLASGWQAIPVDYDPWAVAPKHLGTGT